ncbi:ComF family protein [Robertmurraya andreesenii]|uniref:Competence protein ComFC n=1 Tax=Anoxybacillus andreesenii TaxID=1325932 RepID=A0ABT9V7N1_9BACL|nr:ComF family protein [Robertmurraya andreesenii]MDQ0156932.1 competence protein ComFC [Robertmurraya andreesenii]
MLSEHCLFCHGEMGARVSWACFFEEAEESFLCPSCEAQLTEIQGETCQICCRPLEKLDPQYIHGDLCYDCLRWEEDPEWKGFLRKNDSLYLYNDFLKELISQYKFRGDYILAKAFSRKINEKLRRIEYDYIVPIPLSTKRQFERGFNQSEALIREAGLSPAYLLQRTHSEKQSKKSRSERIHIPQVFELKAESGIKDKKILLIDDIYTTGSTLRHAAKIMMQAGAKSVMSFTLARG